MEFEYRGWVIDATPEFSLGQFFAHARLVRASSGDDVEPEMHIERNLAWFDDQDEAIELARQWAIEWVDAREDKVGSADTDDFIQAQRCSSDRSQVLRKM
ncbi:hypothetical protein ABQJ48_26415 [Paraburkholderia sp. DGU8]